jgi:hypothetical protein
MLSRQIYTPKYSNIPITNIFAGNPEQFTYETPNVVCSGTAQSIKNRFVQQNEETREDRSTKVIFGKSFLGDNVFTYETPSVVSMGIITNNKVKHEIETIAENEQTQPIPIFQYTTKLSTQLFDPTIINTPPSEFMNQLKSRLDGYYSASSS